MDTSRALATIPEGGDLAEVQTVGRILAESGFFSDSKGASQAIAKILAGRELGIGPVAAMTGIYIVQGRVTLSANLMAAAIKRSGRYTYRVKKLDAGGCEIEFFEGGQSIGVSSFGPEDARTAQLNGDNWKKYARNMYFARAMSNGAKWYCADIFAGPVYTPDELGIPADPETGEVVTTTARVIEPEQPAEAGRVAERARASAAPANSNRKMEMAKRYGERFAQAKDLGLNPPSINVDTMTEEQIQQAGVALRNEIEAALAKQAGA